MLTYLAGTSKSFCFLAAAALNWAVGVVSWATSLVVGVRSLGTFWPSSDECMWPEPTQQQAASPSLPMLQRYACGKLPKRFRATALR